MKFLLVLLVVVGGLWWLWRPRAKPPSHAARKDAEGTAPAEMVACAHCDLRLPRAEALFDPKGHPFCSEAHRRAGSR